MPYKQEGRRLKITTPLGPDVLLLNGFSGHEAISRPFSFHLRCVAENATKVAFDALLGQKITVEIALPGGGSRFLNGACLRVAEGARDATFTRFVLDLVPMHFLLARKTQSRIFQQISVPDILKKVLAGLDVTYEIQGLFRAPRLLRAVPRDRLRLRQPADGRRGDLLLLQARGERPHDGRRRTPRRAIPTLPVKTSAHLRDRRRRDPRRRPDHAWEKTQELRSGKVHALGPLLRAAPQAPGGRQARSRTRVPPGRSSHKLKLGANAKLELYDYPGGYAQRFDGVEPGRRRPAGRHPEDLPGQPADRRDPHAGAGRRERPRRRREQLPPVRLRPQVHARAAFRRRRPVRL